MVFLHETDRAFLQSALTEEGYNRIFTVLAMDNHSDRKSTSKATY